MSILQIRTFPDPILRSRAKQVSEINSDIVGAIKDNPIASSIPEIIKREDEKKTANFLFENILLEKSKRLPLFFIIFTFKF